MFFIIALLVTVTIFGAASRRRVPAGANAAHLGWMSKQWLAEYRGARRKQ